MMNEASERLEEACHNDAGVVAQFKTLRVRQLWGSYKRIFQVTGDSVITLDPSDFSVTNTFPYAEITKLVPDDKQDGQFTLEHEKTSYVYKTSHRTLLLCQLFESISRKLPQKFPSSTYFPCARIRKDTSRTDGKLQVTAYALIEVSNQSSRVIKQYSYVNIEKIGFDMRTRAFTFSYSGRSKVFVVDDLSALLVAVKQQLQVVGADRSIAVVEEDANRVIASRSMAYSVIGTAVAMFDVNKLTRRSNRPMPRQLHITEDYVVEKDSSGFQYVSYRHITAIYAIVRCWDNPREFTLEFSDGTSTSYTCAVRDTLLAVLLDIAHAAGNVKVIVTGEISDSLRLMPRFADEEYHTSIKDAFFGSSSIETWFLSQLAKVCKTDGGLDTLAVEKACRELNANVPCPGVTPTTDVNIVRSCLSGVLRSIQAVVLEMLQDERLDHSRKLVTLLQTLYRIIPCVHGYKSFVEVKEVDTRLLLLQLMRLDKDFINYWTLEVLSVLCRCPLVPRNAQQEFVNKHTLLTDQMLKCLIDLMSTRLYPDSDDEDDESGSKTPLESGSNYRDPGDIAQSGARVCLDREFKRFVGPGNEENQQQTLSSSDKSSSGAAAAAAAAARRGSVKVGMSVKMKNLAFHLDDLSNNNNNNSNSAAASASSSSNDGNGSRPVSTRLPSSTTNPTSAGYLADNWEGNKPAVAPNPLPTAHLPAPRPGSSRIKSFSSQLPPVRLQSINGIIDAHTEDDEEEMTFTPNSLVIVGAAGLLESIVSSKRDTSSPELLHKVLDLLGNRSEVLVHMLRSSSFLIMENAAILMFTLLKTRPSIAPSLKEAVLSECLVLKHFYNAAFSPSGSQRFISRFLVATWMSGDEKRNPGKALLKRILPSGLTEYLKHTMIVEEQRRALDDIEEEFYASYVGGGGGGGARGAAGPHQAVSTSASSDLQARMRQRISTAIREHTGSSMDRAVVVSQTVYQPTVHLSGGANATTPIDGAASSASHQHLSVVSEAATAYTTSTGYGNHTGGGEVAGSAVSSPLPVPSTPNHHSQQPASQLPFSPLTTAATIMLPMSPSRQSSISSSSPSVVAVATPSAPPPAHSLENFRILFHMLTRNSQLPDLIWNEQTRLELRSALEVEIRNFEREQRLRGAHKVAWNYQQFSVKYDSLREEMQVGPIYIRHFLDADESFLRALENPSPPILFEKLFRRVLVNIDKNAAMAVHCVRSLCRLYSVCGDIIGTFDDMLLLVRMLDQAANMELQHCLLDLLELLAVREPANLHQLLDQEFVNVVIKFASLAHLNPNQIGNVLARATSNTLLLKDVSSRNISSSSSSDAASTGGTSSSNNGSSGSGGGSSSGSGGAVSATSSDSRKQSRDRDKDREVTEEALIDMETRRLRMKRSLWIPDDIVCPRVWFIAPNGVMPPPVAARKGPYRVTELMVMLDRKDLDETWLLAPSMGDDGDDDRFDAVVDTGLWRTISEYFQLRMQMLFPGKAIYSPAQVAVKSLTLLRNLAAVHKSNNSSGAPFFPIPISKRIMSEPEHLATYVQLLLSNDNEVVEAGADLIRSLVEVNPAANSKLYLTGAFFFACRFTGNNFYPLAMLFEAAHLQQSFESSAESLARDVPLSERSILGTILPIAVVNILINYGAERFATMFTGDFDTPEVIWNAELRKHVVEMIDQHIGDFGDRLRQFTLARYEYCPIPKIHLRSLDKEIYVYEYYLRNFCDEVRFPVWPVGEPLIFLRETLQRWREELSKGVVDSTVDAAKILLGLSEKSFDYTDLRRAYKNLARKYHPDKNPNGRTMFEKIRLAYELLSSIELKVVETDMNNVILLMKTQNIIYRRFPDAVSDQKYPAYNLLINVINVPTVDAAMEGVSSELLLTGTILVYYTCSVSPFNVREFVKVGGVNKLYEIIAFALDAYSNAHLRKLASELLVYAMKSFTAVALFDIGRDCVVELCPKFAEDMHRLLELEKQLPIAVENGLEVISRCCSHGQLQQAFIDAGVIWKLIPMLLAYDGSLDEDFTDENQRVIYNQTASNMYAVLAAKALGRLAGVMFDDLASPPNDSVRDCLSILLTQPLAKLLRNRRPWELLNALNQNVEKTTMIWNVGMRNELLDFVLQVDKERPHGSREDDLRISTAFDFKGLKGELCVGGVYVRIFNKTADTCDIDDPSLFCGELIEFLSLHLEQVYRLGDDNDNDHSSSSPMSLLSLSPSPSWRNNPIVAALLSPFKSPSFGDDSDSDRSLLATRSRYKTFNKDDIDLAVEAVRTLAEKHNYIPYDIAQKPIGVYIVFQLLECPSDSHAFGSTAQLLCILFKSTDFLSVAMRHDPPVVWRLMRALCTAGGTSLNHLWLAAEGLAANPEGLDALLAAGAVVRLLGVIVGVSGYSNAFHNRLSAISLLSKFLWNPIKGPEASAILRRFLPEPVVLLLRSKAGSASLQVLDDVCETPELIWTPEMQGELRGSIATLLVGEAGAVGQPEPATTNLGQSEAATTYYHRNGSTAAATAASVEDFSRPPAFPPEYTVHYRQLSEEIYLGGVYVRLFMKNPTFRLTDPVYFVEKVVEMWEHSFDRQVPKSMEADIESVTMTAQSPSSSGGSGGSGPSQALILGKEDFLALLTSCIICVLKSDSTVVDHLVLWGFGLRLCEFYQRALKFKRLGAPVTCIVRILHQLASRSEAVDSIARASADVISLITQTLDDSSNKPQLPTEAAFVVEVLKRIFQCPGATSRSHLVSMAVKAKTPEFLLDRVLSASNEALAQVRNPSALHVHAVDTLKAIQTAAEGADKLLLQTLLDRHKAWNDYKYQSHDLFITDRERTDHFLIEDSVENRFAGLLTDVNSNSNGYGSNPNTGSSIAGGTNTAAPVPEATTSSSSSSTSAAASDADMVGTSSSAHAINNNNNSNPATRQQPPRKSEAPATSLKPTFLTNPLAVGSIPEVLLPRDPLPSPPPPAAATSSTASRSSTVPHSIAAVATAAAAPYTQQSKMRSKITPPLFVEPPVHSSLPRPITTASSGGLAGTTTGTTGGGGEIKYSKTTRGSTSTSTVLQPQGNHSNNHSSLVYRTVIVKGDHGIGLDLGKTEDGKVLVQRLKVLPPGIINPAAKASPPVRAGDFIVAVNGHHGLSFADSVKAIRSSNVNVELELERGDPAAHF